MAATIREQIEALPDDQRTALKLRAKSIKEEVLNRAPGLCKAPFENALHEVCVVSAFDDHLTGNIHDGETLIVVRDILDGMADRHDIHAMAATEDEGVVRFRDLEEGFRALSRTVESMRQDEFSLTPSTEGTTPAR